MAIVTFLPETLSCEISPEMADSAIHSLPLGPCVSRFHWFTLNNQGICNKQWGIKHSSGSYAKFPLSTPTHIEQAGTDC